MPIKRQFEEKNNELLVRAPAKLNLTLLVAGKRPDGFHELETIMAKIDYYDELFFAKGGKGGIDLLCEGPLWSPEGPDNLVYTSAEKLMKHCGVKENVQIRLLKNIPAGSGLGSASSDAAATLMGLSKLLQLPVTNEELMEISSELGSDVSFFLGEPLAFCTGKGEIITEIDKKFAFSAVLVIPDINVSTAKVYKDYKHCNDLYLGLNSKINDCLEKNRIDLAVKMCANMLEISCFGIHKELLDIKEKIRGMFDVKPCLSGSGASMFFLLEDDDDKKQRNYLEKIKKEIDCCAYIVHNNSW